MSIHDYLEAAGFGCTSQWPPPRDWTGEVRAALHAYHGLRAWELALESKRFELVQYVEGYTGGLEFSYDDKRHIVWLCDVTIATATQSFTVRDQPGGPVRVDQTFIQTIHRHREIVLLVKAAIKERLGKPQVTTRLSRSEALALTTYNGTILGMSIEAAGSAALNLVPGAHYQRAAGSRYAMNRWPGTWPTPGE